MKSFNVYQNFYHFFTKIIIIFMFLVVVSFSPCFAETYYVDSSGGADSYEGLSESTAWKSLNKVANYSFSPGFSPGDLILFKRGEEWNERVNFSSSGSEGSPITLGAYGSGPKPKFTFSYTLNGWSSEGGGVYSKAVNASEGFFEDGQMIHFASNQYLTDGNWYYTNGKTYYKPTSGVPSDHTLLYSTSYYLIKIIGQSYINIKNIEMTYAGGGIHIEGGSHIKITDCDLSYIFGWAIQLKDTNGNFSVINNTITKVIDGIYLVGDPGDNHVISNNTIAYTNYEEYNGRDGHGIALQNSNNNIISNNTLSFSRMAPIALWVGNGKTGNNNIISFNRISNNKKIYSQSFYGTGIALTSDVDGTTSGNKVYYNIIENCNVGIKVMRYNFPGNVVYNNVIYDCSKGIKLSKGADNNIFKNNIIYGTDSLHIDSQHNDVGDNNVFDNNCYYPDTSNGFKHKGGILPNFAAWKIATGEDVNSRISDPLFRDVNLFTLKSGSPCVDAGADVGLSQDIYETLVPQGNGVDIGVSEFQKVLKPPIRLRLLR